MNGPTAMPKGALCSLPLTCLIACDGGLRDPAARSPLEAGALEAGALLAVEAGLVLPSAFDGGEGGEAALPAAPYEAFAPIARLIAARCSFDRCHGAGAYGGGIDFGGRSDPYEQLVGVASCQYPPYQRVQPGAPDRSWLMVKLTAEARPASDPLATYILFTPETGFDPSARGCPDQTDDGTPLFGTRMPGTAPNMLESSELETIRRWIADGAKR
jgi:hypothetical protein